jgi:hypothetical protein
VLVVTGQVEVLDSKEILGWVSPVGEDTGPIRVSLHVDGKEVAVTWAAASVQRSTPNARKFRLGISDIWSFLKSIDQLTVHAGGTELPIAIRTEAATASPASKYPTRDIFSKIGKGFVFNQFGRFRLSKKVDYKWQKDVTGLYERLAATIRSILGYEMFLCYGTMLGYVREKGIIGHDVDFDCAYISRHSDGRAAAAEIKQFALGLIEAGYEVTCKKSCLDISDPRANGVSIDLFHLYFDEADELAFPFGVAGTSTLKKSDLRIERREFLGKLVAVPVPEEAFVEHVYGEHWRVPNPGFNWRADRTKRARAGLIAEPAANEVYWANFYAHASYKSGSSFFEFVAKRPETPPNIFEVGCGDGRDAISFGTGGRRVLGIDRSTVGIDHANEKSERARVAEKVQFATVDVSDTASLRAAFQRAREAAGSSPVMIYTRFFLHSITENVQHAMMVSLSSDMRPGDMFAAEFRTDKDEHQKHVHGDDHYRRYQNAAEFSRQLTQDYGLRVLYEHEGIDLSPYKGENPVLCRVIARR